MARSIRAFGWRRGLAAVVACSVLAACGAALADDPDPASLPCAPPTAAELERAIEQSVAWLGRAVRPDGRFWYEYDRSTDRFAPGYNDVRHAGTMMSLYQVAAAGRPGAIDAIEVADRGLGYVRRGLVVDGDRAAFVGSSPSAELGATALTVAGLVHRRRATGDRAHDDLLRSLGRFMDSLRRPDGGMWSHATREGLAPIEGRTSTFFTGEAFWAYGLLADQFPGEGWDVAARAVGRYIVTDRDAEEGIESRPHPDQWAAYGFAELAGQLDAGERDYVRALAGRYGRRVDGELERERRRIGDGRGAPDETVEQSRGAAFGTTVEALGSLWRLAGTDPELTGLRDELRADLVCGAGVLAARQYDAARAAAWPRPEVVHGAWFRDDVTRVDDQQHAMSGVLLALAASW